MAETAKWYVVHTYSGYENAVATAVMKAAENRKMTDLIEEVRIPLETVTEFTDAGEKTVERKVFPGYVLIKMILTDESCILSTMSAVQRVLSVRTAKPFP